MEEMNRMKEIGSFLKGFQCSCGRWHDCEIRDVVIGQNVLERIPGLLGDIHSVVIVSDRNTRPLAADRLISILQGAGISHTEMYFDQSEVVIPNEASIDRVDRAVTDGTQALIGIGSGVISDLCKYVSFRRGLPYMIVATAPSMDGYASKGAALVLKGMKVTETTHVPTWVVGDVDILKDAPMKMIRAGIGDILGKYSCLNDWKLASIILGEHMCDWIYNMILKEVRTCARNIEGCMRRDPEAIGALMNSLVQVGVAISYMGNSRPASGSEHHFSHFFEITGIVHGRRYLDHGIDVAYSAILTAHLREMLAASNPSSFARRHDEAEWCAGVDRVFGSLAPEIKALQEKVGYYRDDRSGFIREHWDEIRAVLREAPTRREMTDLLRRAGYEMDSFVDFYGENVLRDCIRFAKDLKDRYTLLWVLEDVGLLEDFSRHVKLKVGWKGFDRKMLVAGHRGACHAHPENTMSAFRRAISLGVDMIETDVRMTKDGELVIMHDATVDRTTDGSGLVREMTLAQFKSLNAAHDFDGLGFEAPPTLREFLELLQHEAPNMLVDFELKEYPVDGRDDFAYECCDKTLKMVEEFGLTNRCIINSFSGKLLEYVHRKYPGRYRLHGYYPFWIMGEMTMAPRDLLYCCCMISERLTPEGKPVARCESVCPAAWFDDVVSQGILPGVGAGLRSAEELQRSLDCGCFMVTSDYPEESLLQVERLDVRSRQ